MGRLWDYCACCGKRIEVGEKCYGLSNGDSVCTDCVVAENDGAAVSDGEEEQEELTMAEYIEREAAIDAIMKVYVRTAGHKARERVFEAEEAVHRLPVADVAPVVRCKECKWAGGDFVCYRGVMVQHKPEDFCSYGERRGGGEDD